MAHQLVAVHEVDQQRSKITMSEEHARSGLICRIYYDNGLDLILRMFNISFFRMSTSSSKNRLLIERDVQCLHFSSALTSLEITPTA